MPARITKIFTATTFALALGVMAAPAATAATSEVQLPVVPGLGSVEICVPLGSAEVCI